MSAKPERALIAMSFGLNALLLHRHRHMARALIAGAADWIALLLSHSRLSTKNA